MACRVGNCPGDAVAVGYCERHWGHVPPHLRDKLTSLYVEGQEHNGNNKPAWMAAAIEANGICRRAEEGEG